MFEMSEKTVSVPTIKGIGSAFKDFGIGALGGLVFLVAYSLFGGLGVIAAPLIVGSMLKGGNRGEIIATMAGFMLVAIGAFGVGSSSTSSTSRTTM
jgi:hypothetical protein